jgi:hypothetical protein
VSRGSVAFSVGFKSSLNAVRPGVWGTTPYKNPTENDIRGWFRLTTLQQQARRRRCSRLFLHVMTPQF